MERKTLNFDAPLTWVREYATPGTPGHQALAAVTGDPALKLASESAVLVSLVEYAHARVEEEKLRLMYDEACAGQPLEAEAEAAMDLLEQSVMTDLGG
jgi:hypothetical protein